MADPDLRAHLAALGASDEQLVGLEDGELIGLASDLRLAEGLDLDLDGLVQATGRPVDEVRGIYASLGLDVDELAGFGADDVAIVSLIAGDTTGIIDQVGPPLLRVTGSVLSRLADAMVAAYVQDIEGRSGDDDLLSAADQNMLASTLAVALGDGLPAVFRHHMWLAVRRQRQAQHDVATPEVVRLAVGFVDLVGFTSLSHVSSPAELLATVERFELRAFETAQRHGGRIVKSIGDEVMIAADDPAVVAAISLELIEERADDDEVQARGGVSAGDVLFRLGDYYGPVVNLAARLVAEAIPGEVLTDRSDITAPGLRTEPAGRRLLRGLPEPVRVWSISRARPAALP